MTNTLVIARRKGVKVRMFDTSTAKMGPWVTDDIAVRERAVRRESAARAGRCIAPLAMIHNRASLEAYTVAKIRTAGQKVLGMSFPSKARKADMVTSYLAEQARRLA